MFLEKGYDFLKNNKDEKFTLKNLGTVSLGGEGIKYDLLENNDIHVHVPEGAIPKDGPSAGIALTTALLSALKGIKVNKKIAMTGEITLRGNILKIGGLKEKTIGAHRNGIKEIYIPIDNVVDTIEIPEEIKQDITFIPVKNYKEIYEHLMEGNKVDEKQSI